MAARPSPKPAPRKAMSKSAVAPKMKSATTSARAKANSGPRPAPAAGKVPGRSHPQKYYTNGQVNELGGERMAGLDQSNRVRPTSQRAPKSITQGRAAEAQAANKAKASAARKRTNSGGK